ncbi:MAG TPA: 50S ribosomal protein L17 [bacterium]|nr:50S ribosomal protein L17 [bacterium]
MRHKKNVVRLGRNKSHRKSLSRNMAIGFFQNKKIITTQARAKQLKPVLERLITIGKDPTPANVRRINAYLNHLSSTRIAVELGQRFKERNGGYIKIIKLGYRRGDASKMAIIKIVE